MSYSTPKPSQAPVRLEAPTTPQELLQASSEVDQLQICAQDIGTAIELIRLQEGKIQLLGDEQQRLMGMITSQGTRLEHLVALVEAMAASRPTTLASASEQLQSTGVSALSSRSPIVKAPAIGSRLPHTDKPAIGSFPQSTVPAAKPVTKPAVAKVASGAKSFTKGHAAASPSWPSSSIRPLAGKVGMSLFGKRKGKGKGCGKTDLGSKTK
eukprot:53930-Amphidinium_carterae.3